MSTSFIVNPEIRLVITKKSLSSLTKSKDGKGSKTSTQSQVNFSEREQELLKKLSDFEISIEKPAEQKENTAKRDKTTTLTLNGLKELKASLEAGSYLCDAIGEAELILPENEIVERNPVLEKRIQRLKREQEQRVYNTMTKNVDTSRRFEPEETISYQCKLTLVHPAKLQVR